MRGDAKTSDGNTFPLLMERFEFRTWMAVTLVLFSLTPQPLPTLQSFICVSDKWERIRNKRKQKLFYSLWICKSGWSESCDLSLMMSYWKKKRKHKWTTNICYNISIPYKTLLNAEKILSVGRGPRKNFVAEDG